MTFNDLAKAQQRERANYVVAAAGKFGLSELIVEKDFWVVWILERLFEFSSILGPFTFKGGTSLSKGFRAIERFSEDVDISINRATLGFVNDDYFYDAASTNERKRRVRNIRETVHKYVEETIRPMLSSVIARELENDRTWTLESSEPGTIRFRYPGSEGNRAGYVRPDVLIEFGHADTWPAEDVTIRPYIAEAIESVSAAVKVRVLDPRRTFWEKATLVHEIANRDASLSFPKRNTRHYYDLAMLGRSAIGDAALQDVQLLATVVKFKETFFASIRARYDLAKPGTFRLMFPDFRSSEIESDYAEMLPMFFGRPPSFGDLCDDIRKLEARINAMTG